MIVFAIRIFVNNESPTYDTSSLSPCKGGIQDDNMLGYFCVSSMNTHFDMKVLNNLI